jgi:hypothetical protein
MPAFIPPDKKFCRIAAAPSLSGTNLEKNLASQL